MKKYLLAGAVVAIVGGALLVYNTNGNTESENIVITQSESNEIMESLKVKYEGESTVSITNGVSLEFAEGYRVKEIARQSKELVNANQLQVTFKVMSNFQSIGNLVITTREIDNGDVVVYQEMEYEVNREKTIPMKIVVDKASKYSMFEMAEKNVQREHNKTFGIDMTTNVRGILQFKNDSDKQVADIYLSQNYISKSLEYEYEDGEKSVIRELKEENTQFKVNDESGKYTIENNLKLLPGADNSESWFVVSNGGLIEKDSVKESYKNKTNYNFIQNAKWQVSDGNYTKLPWSIEPFKEMGYGRNLVALQDDTSLNYYRDSKDRLFYDLSIISINNLLEFKGEKHLWETEYTSTWLKKSYGITAPYVDTRHNENIALFLGEAGETLDIEELKKSPLNYADFLTEQEANGNVIETKNGYFIADYFSEDADAKTHTSLNHALGEANFLMSLYFGENMDYKNQFYLETALKIYQAIEDTSDEWIRDNGDFWYQISSDGTYSDTDYNTLTLDDIALAMVRLNKQNLLSEYPALEKMMLSKLNYVMKQGYGIAELTVENLKELGFEEQIKEYKNVLKF